ncbi:hypothetical protein RJ035_003817 [Blastomyces gilchristii]
MAAYTTFRDKKCLCGWAKIKLKCLDFESNAGHRSRTLDRKYGETPLIPRETLNRTLILSRREPQELFLVGEEPPDLELPEGPKLRVLTGRHRLLASQQFLGVVDGSCTMRSRSFCAGDKFRNLRLHQILGDDVEEAGWHACFEKSELETFTEGLASRRLHVHIFA